MASRSKLTNSSDESEIAGLLSGDLVYEIPYFQRPYKWKADRLQKLEEDIKAVVDGSVDSHFMGAIIMHGRRSNPSEPTNYELIDGQQRLTTIFLYICAAVKCLCKNGLRDEAASLFQKYLVLGRSTSLISNIKLHSCGEDRGQMNVVMSDLISDLAFLEKLGSNFKPRPLPNTGNPSGTLLRNYRSALRFMDNQAKEGGTDRVRDVYVAMLEKMSVVQIDVWDPTNGPKIFDSLNSKQEPMTIGDLVRNDIFSRVAGSNPSEIELIDRDQWQPFYQQFVHESRNHFESYFFPFGLIHNPNLTKSTTYGQLKERWQKLDEPSLVIEDLRRYQNAFLDIVTGANSQGHPKDVAAAFKRLSSLRAPNSTYPFIMQLSEETRTGTVSPAAAIAVAGLIENFLVRRALSGIEPTGLHAVFKRLWMDCAGDISPAKVKSLIRSRTTVSWPTDDQVIDGIKSRPMYEATILPFIMREFDLSLGGDAPTNVPWIEHILPQTLSDSWKLEFTDTQHREMLHLLANLLPLAPDMNRELSNRPYDKKRERFKADSMFKTTRNFAAEYDAWTPALLSKRSEQLAQWAVLRWPG